MANRTERDGFRATAIRRLSSSRYPLGAAGVIALVYGLASGTFALAAALYGILIAAAVLGPRRSRAQRIRERLDRFRARERERRPSVNAILNALPDPVIEVNGTGVITRANAAAREAFGAELNGLPLLARFRSVELRELVANVDEHAGSGMTTTQAAFGTERLYIVHAGLAPARGGDPLGSKRRIVLAFREQTRQIREERTRSDFVANASHELRTPLTSLIGFIETLRGPARDDADARERFLAIMDDQARRMARLVDGLLALSRAERASSVRPREQVDLAEVVREIHEHSLSRFEDAGVSLDLHLDAGQAFVRADRDGLVQVLTNLIENALRYGHEGGRAEIALETDGERATIRVRDWGKGFDPVHIPRLTERFYRVDPERSSAVGATGLGLAITKHILARHGTRLHVESRPGDGAEFRFSLVLMEENSEVGTVT